MSNFLDRLIKFSEELKTLESKNTTEKWYKIDDYRSSVTFYFNDGGATTLSILGLKGVYLRKRNKEWHLILVFIDRDNYNLSFNYRPEKLFNKLSERVI